MFPGQIHCPEHVCGNLDSQEYVRSFQIPSDYFVLFLFLSFFGFVLFRLLLALNSNATLDCCDVQQLLLWFFFFFGGGGGGKALGRELSTENEL